MSGASSLQATLLCMPYANAASSDCANTRNWLASGVKFDSCVARCSDSGSSAAWSSL